MTFSISNMFRSGVSSTNLRSLVGTSNANTATSLLRGLMDDFAGAGHDAIESALRNSPLRDPLHALLSAGEDLGDAGIDRVGDLVYERTTGDKITTATPSLSSSGRSECMTFAERKAMESGVYGSSSSGSTSTSRSAYSSGGSGSYLETFGEFPNKPGLPNGKKNIGDLDDKELLQYQEQMQKYNRLITMITQLMQMDHEAKKSVIQNFRA